MPEDDGPITVLVADDHPLYRAGVTRLVRSLAGFRLVGEAADGEEALAQLRELRPDVAVLDVTMPRLDGLGVLAAVAAEGLPTRVLLLSGTEEPATVYGGLRAGASGFLMKTAGTAAIADAVGRAARGEKVLPPDTARAVERLRHAPALTPRQREALALVAEGRTRAEVADTLGISEGTVKDHLSAAYQRLGVQGSAAAIAAAMRRGFLK